MLALQERSFLKIFPPKYRIGFFFFSRNLTFTLLYESQIFRKETEKQQKSLKLAALYKYIFFNYSSKREIFAMM